VVRRVYTGLATVPVFWYFCTLVTMGAVGNVLLTPVKVYTVLFLPGSNTVVVEPLRVYVVVPSAVVRVIDMTVPVAQSRLP
jgi:hypothetical protein